MIRFCLGAVLLTVGLVLYAIQFVGVFRFRSVLNRMHAAAIGDSLGIACVLLGACFMYGLSFATLKLLLMLVFLWFTSPVATHMLARLVVLSQADPSDLCPVMEEEELREEQGCS